MKRLELASHWRLKRWRSGQKFFGLFFIGLTCFFASVPARAADWPSDTRLSGNAFLPSGLLKMQADTANSPVTLWLDRGRALWADGSTGPSCQSCHGPVESLKTAAPSFPRLDSDGKRLINLEDQIGACRSRGGRSDTKAEDDDGLALSALLHDAAKGQAISLAPSLGQSTEWQAHLARGAKLFSTRLGRINLACVHCHEQNVGKQMRADVISPANPTGFPIYRMSWQRLGSIERRLRACYSGVQAELPAPGDPVLRELELYLKVRAKGMLLEGPSIRR
jgi:sulfur-oxidizing protein SoxA